MNVFDELKRRGLIAQTTHEEEIRELLGHEKVTFYIGFDPTADSLHVGHYLQLVVMAHMQRAGHRPIAILGGGTGMVGDPTGKTDMRKMMTPETVAHNANCFKEQMARLVDFSDGKALMIDNGDWLLKLNYIEFLREVGIHFSVNKMLTYECFKTRLEKGLSFIEFNYMLMQSYDFLKLYRDYGCKLELGGDDQWANILGGIELVRRAEGEQVYGMTFTLLTNSNGVKMGKTVGGAVWLDPEKFSPYDFYQYWRNVEDADVVRFLKMLTFLDVDYIESEFGHCEGAELNRAKEVLAFEVTKQVHGEEEAVKAQNTARKVFAGTGVDENMPTVEVSFEEGISLLDLMASTGITPSKGEARRLVQQGGVSLGGEKVTDIAYQVTDADFGEGYLVLKKGKKAIYKVVKK